MISVPLYDNQGRTLEPVQVDETVLGENVRNALMREAVQMYENNRHVCTKGTLTRGMVSVSTRKMHKQKHTGAARVGSDSTPQRRGGGVAFAPQTRNLTYHMPRQARRVATRSALLSRLRDNVVNIVNDFQFETPKTKSMAALLKSLGVAGRCLIVIESDNPLVWKSARNIVGVTVRRVADLNAYDLLQPDRLVFTQAALQRALEACAS